MIVPRDVTNTLEDVSARILDTGRPATVGRKSLTKSEKVLLRLCSDR